MKYQVFATHFFEVRLKKLSRKYNHIFEDYKSIVEELEQNLYQGDRIKGCIGLVFKIRMASRDMRRGKSGGFRIISLIRPEQSAVYLLTIYAKSEHETIDVKEINSILTGAGFVERKK